MHAGLRGGQARGAGVPGHLGSSSGFKFICMQGYEAAKHAALAFLGILVWV